MSLLLKNHFRYLFKNKIALTFLSLSFLLIFGNLPFNLVNNLFFGYNWITFLICYVVIVIQSLMFFQIIFNNSKINQYDQILNSTFSNKRKIFGSKLIFGIIFFIFSSLIIASLNAIFLASKVKTNSRIFLYFISLFFFNLLAFIFSFNIIIFFATLIKNNAFRNSLNLVVAGILIATPIISRTLIYESPEKINWNNYKKVIEITKDNKEITHYVFENIDELNNQSNSHSKYYFDVINAFYLAPSTIMKSIINDCDVKPYEITNSKYNNYVFDQKLKIKNWELASNYYVYNVNDIDLAKYDNSKLINLIQKEIFANLVSKDFLEIKNLVKSPIWNADLFSNEQLLSLKTILGYKSKNVQYLRRDFASLIKNNLQLQKDIMDKFGLDFYNLLITLYIDNAYTTSQITTRQSSNNPFYIKNLIPENGYYNQDTKITDEDKNYLQNSLLSFSSANVILRNEKLETFSITLSKFQNVFEDINNLDDWKTLIEEKSNKLKDINEILESLYTLSDPNNEILKFKLQPNSSFVNQYKYVTEFKTKLVSTNDVVLFILLFDITLALLTYMILKSRRKNY